MRRGIAAVAALLAAGCGAGGVDRTKLEAVAAAWVEAVDDQDWGRVCELSVRPAGAPCEDVDETLLGDLRDVGLEGVYASGDTATMAMSAGSGDLPDDLRLERAGDRWVVHFEVQRLT